ncbi:MAG: hypothetical protein JRM78_02505 [Nitrososphaerota archaeon]|nr:hypothetical protein [Nitrososphaerota archaeon]MDG7041926.1 hypothetical protein [Nitrososphaerota archaeon]MDG7047499.1 hypothetical protein [Nitrososphaerota archaeon]
MKGHGYYVPHPLYPYVRYSRNQDRVDFGGSVEGYFSENSEEKLNRALDTLGWVYCVDCRHALFSREEAMEHINGGHSLTVEFMPDRVAPEEVPAAD